MDTSIHDRKTFDSLLGCLPVADILANCLDCRALGFQGVQTGLGLGEGVDLGAKLRQANGDPSAYAGTGAGHQNPFARKIAHSFDEIF